MGAFLWIAGATVAGAGVVALVMLLMLRVMHINFEGSEWLSGVRHVCGHMRSGSGDRICEKCGDRPGDWIPVVIRRRFFGGWRVK